MGKIGAKFKLLIVSGQPYENIAGKKDYPEELHRNVNDEVLFIHKLCLFLMTTNYT